MIGYLVERIGRPATFAILGLSGLVIVLCLLASMWVFGPNPPPTITPATVESEGCCTVVVHVSWGGVPINGRYEVVTEEGRLPRRTSGEFSDGKIQVLVGDDWIGQIRIKYGSYEKLTDLIGGQFGIDERTVDMAAG